MSAAGYQSVIWTLIECQEARLVLNFLDAQTQPLTKLHVDSTDPGLKRLLFTYGIYAIHEVSILFLALKP